MIRAILCTLTLIVALTAASAQAGGFKFKLGGGHKNGIKFHWNGHHKRHYRKHHAPVVRTPCYYQVCYYAPNWNSKKHEVFSSLHEAQVFAAKVRHLGYIASVSKYDPHYNTGLGRKWLP